MYKLHIDDFDNEETTIQRNKCQQYAICFVSFWRCIAIILAIITAFCTLFVFKTYLKWILLWLESQNSLIIAATISVLFVVVSLPISLGYIVLVVAEGYLFGWMRGLSLTVIGANLGLFFAHNILKVVGHHRAVYQYTQNQTAQAIMRVIAGPLCFKIVLCSRLTPIPFGLQNAIFALSNVNTRIYHLASFLGLLPAQFVGVYMGSTLRSMQDVLENRQISSNTYLFIAFQLVSAVFLMAWISAKARTELLKALAQADNNPAPLKTATPFSIV